MMNGFAIAQVPSEQILCHENVLEDIAPAPLPMRPDAPRGSETHARVIGAHQVAALTVEPDPRIGSTGR